MTDATHVVGALLDGARAFSEAIDRCAPSSDSDGNARSAPDRAPNCSPSGGAARSDAGAEPPATPEAARAPELVRDLDRRPLWRRLLDVQGDLSSAVLLAADGHDTAARAVAASVARELARLGGVA